MTKRFLLPRALTCCVLGLLVSGPGTVHASERRPNVVLISVDTLRSDHTTPYGYEKDTTPTLSALAARGVVFEAAYAPMPSTGPSHTTMLTGLFPVAHGVEKNGSALADSHTTLTEVLKKNGYATDGVVSSFVLDRRFGLAQGFDTYEDHFTPEEASLKSRKFRGHALEKGAGFDRPANRTTEVAIERIAERAKEGRPFFLFVHYMDPHAPYVPPKPYRDLFAPPDLRLNYLDREIALYDAEIAFVDAEIGNLFEALRTAGVFDDTLVVVTADHGEGLMDHGFMAHGHTIYQETMRVPLIVSWPAALPQGRRIAEPVQLTDLMPTVLDLLSVDSDEPFDGISLRPAIFGEEALSADRRIYIQRRHYELFVLPSSRDFRPSPPFVSTYGIFQLYGEKFGIIEGSLKYIQPEQFGGAIQELYDLEADPNETVNIAGENPAESKALAGGIAEWLSQKRREQGEAPYELTGEDREALEAMGYVQ